MTEQELRNIENVLRGPEEPDVDWFVTTIKKLVKAVRNLQHSDDEDQPT